MASRAPPTELPVLARDDYYLDLWVPRLRHCNASFPHRRRIFQLATEIFHNLSLFRLGHITLRRAQDKALQNRAFLRSELRARIVTFRDLMKRSYPVSAVAMCATLGEAETFHDGPDLLFVGQPFGGPSRPRSARGTLERTW